MQKSKKIKIYKICIQLSIYKYCMQIVQDDKIIKRPWFSRHPVK